MPSAPRPDLQAVMGRGFAWRLPHLAPPRRVPSTHSPRCTDPSSLLPLQTEASSRSQGEPGCLLGIRPCLRSPGVSTEPTLGPGIPCPPQALSTPQPAGQEGSTPAPSAPRVPRRQTSHHGNNSQVPAHPMGPVQPRIHLTPDLGVLATRQGDPDHAHAHAHSTHSCLWLWPDPQARAAWRGDGPAAI